MDKFDKPNCFQVIIWRQCPTNNFCQIGIFPEKTICMNLFYRGRKKSSSMVSRMTMKKKDNLNSNF